jgi:hypothetical protein
MGSGERRLTLPRALNAGEGTGAEGELLAPQAFTPCRMTKGDGISVVPSQVEGAQALQYGIARFEDTGHASWANPEDLRPQWVANQLKSW